MAFPRSGTVDTQTFSGTKDFIQARLHAAQSSNIGAGDHVKFDSIDYQRGGGLNTTVTGAASGGAVSLDTSTAYVTTLNVTTIGRFGLRGGKVYRLTVNPGHVTFSGATGALQYEWYDTTGNAVIGVATAQVLALTDATNEGQGGSLSVFFAPGGGQQDISYVELRIVAATALTSLDADTWHVCVETY
jgi:hypothetical protein